MIDYGFTAATQADLHLAFANLCR